jgi:hypothetical protein
MGIGAAALYGRLRRAPVLCWGLAAGGLVNWVAGMHYVPTLSREAIEAVADVDFVARVSRTLPQGSVVISPDPCMWLLQGVNSSQFFLLDQMVHTQLRELASQYPGGVYVHWSFWHNAEPASAVITAKLLAETNATVFARAQSQAFKLALFRIDTPDGLARFGGQAPVSNRPDSDLDRLLARARADLDAPAAPAPAP